jgi:hypothetical protein
MDAESPTGNKTQWCLQLAFRTGLEPPNRYARRRALLYRVICRVNYDVRSQDQRLDYTRVAAVSSSAQNDWMRQRDVKLTREVCDTHPEVDKLVGHRVICTATP